MSIETASLLVTLMSAYLGAGVLFSVFFVFAGVSKVDPEGASMPLTVRLLILPGCVILWPLMMSKWIKRSGPPVT